MANFEKLENSRVKFQITISSEEFEKGIQTAYIKNKGKYSLSGFRRGKAPKKMLERAYGEDLFFGEAIEELYWKAYIDAVVEYKVEPVDSPELDVKQVGYDKELIIDVTVAVKPEIELEESQYKGIEVVRAEYNVTDAMVEGEIDKERQKLVRWVEVDRAIENGDRLDIDYSGSVDGELFDGGTAEHQTLDIGSKRFIPGFEEQLVGKTKGENCDITVTFPTEYHSEDLAGKEAVFNVTIHEIKSKELPEIDDEFAKDVSEFDTMDEYSQDIRAKLVERAEEEARVQTRNNSIEAIVSKLDAYVPDAMVEREVNYRINDMGARLQKQGISLEAYAGYTGISIDNMKDDMRPNARTRVLAELVLESIVKKLDIQVTEQEVEEELMAIGKRYSKDLEEVKQALGETEINTLKTDIAVRKAVDYIIDNAILVDPPVDSEKAV